MRPLLAISFLCISTAAVADVTLKCEANALCDGYLKTCALDPYPPFSVTVSPESKTVTVGGRQLKADFSNPAEVSFSWLKYTVRMNRYEYSVILAAEDEVRYGWCKKVEPAW
jgi:hypothetical protein